MRFWTLLPETRSGGRSSDGLFPLQPPKARSWHALAVSTDEAPNWRPDGWADWTHERRRIWRLEQQLLRWEALAVAARSLAYEQAAIVAELRGEATPAQADIDRVVIENARSRWKGAIGEIEASSALNRDARKAKGLTGAPNHWRVTVNDLVSIFRQGLLDLIPTFGRAEIRWRDDPYDDFDRIAEALYDSIVRDSVRYSITTRAAFEVARYGMHDTGRPYSRILVNDANSGLALLDLATGQEPFDTIECLQVGPDGREIREAGTLSFQGATFVCQVQFPEDLSPRFISELDVQL